jgi:hypothetical protein
MHHQRHRRLATRPDDNGRLCHAPAAGHWAQTASGETYQPLAPALHRRLAQARFLGYGPDQLPSWYTLAELASL